MHSTNAHWESGAIPGPALIARVGTLLGELATAGVLLGAEGLRASSEGVRLRFTAGMRTLVHGPFEGDNELAAGFSIVRTRSLEDAIEWATREADVLGDVEIDIRPITEPWDIGMSATPADGRRAPLHGAPQGYPFDGGWRGADPGTTHSARGSHRRDHPQWNAPRHRKYPSKQEGPALQELPGWRQRVRRAVHRDQGTDCRLCGRIGGVAR